MPFSKRKRKCLTKQITSNICQPLAPYLNGLVLKGYDVVEYFNLTPKSEGVQGSDSYSYLYNNGGGNYTFYFKNQTNRDLFANDPEKYLPQFGGFCSWGFANEWGSIVKGVTRGDPNVPEDCGECINNPPWAWTKYVMGPPADPVNGWTVYNDKLYFNINSSYRERWEANIDVNIQRARDRWRSYYCDAVGPLNVKSYPDTWRESTTITPGQQECLLKDLERQTFKYIKF